MFKNQFYTLINFNWIEFSAIFFHFLSKNKDIKSKVSFILSDYRSTTSHWFQLYICLKETFEGVLIGFPPTKIDCLTLISYSKTLENYSTNCMNTSGRCRCFISFLPFRKKCKSTREKILIISEQSSFIQIEFKILNCRPYWTHHYYWLLLALLVLNHYATDIINWMKNELWGKISKIS